MMNYYSDMWGKRSEILAPLASLTSKAAKWKWEAKHQKAFDNMKAMIAKEALLAYPDFTEEFVIHTDASHTQLGVVILQRGKPIAFYSRKLKPQQTRYTTTEQELLSIVETLDEFRNILLGQKIVVYTDHKNLTCKNFNTEHVMRWSLLLKEYRPDLNYIKGESNVVADALSRLDMLADHPVSKEEVAEMFAADSDTGTWAKVFPLAYSNIEDYQKNDPKIQKAF
jgi:RNase H-like domain found in reverse transcriptase